VEVVRDVEWKLALPETELDPARFRGELEDLPAVPQPGDWCTIVWAAEDGELRLTFVAYEPKRTTSLFVDRRLPFSPLEATVPGGGGSPGSVLARDAATRGQGALPSGKD
jgi:hypothetical protein